MLQLDQARVEIWVNWNDSTAALLDARSCSASDFPISPVGSASIGQVRLAISPAAPASLDLTDGVDAQAAGEVE
jgi:hypothetical protein